MFSGAWLSVTWPLIAANVVVFRAEDIKVKSPSAVYKTSPATSLIFFSDDRYSSFFLIRSLTGEPKNVLVSGVPLLLFVSVLWVLV